VCAKPVPTPKARDQLIVDAFTSIANTYPNADLHIVVEGNAPNEAKTVEQIVCAGVRRTVPNSPELYMEFKQSRFRHGGVPLTHQTKDWAFQYLGQALNAGMIGWTDTRWLCNNFGNPERAIRETIKQLANVHVEYDQRRSDKHKAYHITGKSGPGTNDDIAVGLALTCWYGYTHAKSIL